MSKFKVGDKVMFNGDEVELAAHDAARDWWLFAYPHGDKAMDCCHASKLTPAAPPKLGKVRVVLRDGGYASAWSEKEGLDKALHASDDPVVYDRILDLDVLDADAKALAEERQEHQATSRLYAEARARVAELEKVRDAYARDMERANAQLAASDAKPGAGRYRWAKRMYADGWGVLAREGQPDFGCDAGLKGTRTEFIGDEHGNPVSDLIPLDDLAKCGVFLNYIPTLRIIHVTMVDEIGRISGFLGDDGKIMREGWSAKKFESMAAAWQAASDYAKAQEAKR